MATLSLSTSWTSSKSSAHAPIDDTLSALPAARRDLTQIWRYTAKQWSSDQAERYTAEIVDACRALSEGAKKGRPIDYIRPGYFKLGVRSHIIYYRVRDDGAYIVARILHERMDTSAHLR